MKIIEKKEQEFIVGGGWVLCPDGTWVFEPDDDDPENENESINI